MTDDKVAVLIKLNKKVHDALVLYKQMTGLSVSSQIYGAIAKELFLKKLLSLKELEGEVKE